MDSRDSEGMVIVAGIFIILLSFAGSTVTGVDPFTVFIVGSSVTILSAIVILGAIVFSVILVSSYRRAKSEGVSSERVSWSLMKRDVAVFFKHFRRHFGEILEYLSSTDGGVVIRQVMLEAGDAWSSFVSRPGVDVVWAKVSWGGGKLVRICGSGARLVRLGVWNGIKLFRKD